MKKLLLAFLTISAFSFRLAAQEVDTVPISTKGLDIKLKRSPLPSRIGTIQFKPVNLSPALVNAKVNYWKTRTSVGININQAAFSDNWKGGGVNSLAIGGLINYKAEYSKESYSYASEVILQYGKVKNKSQLQKKTTDRIYWDNKAAVQLSKNWYFFGSMNFESQFDKGFSYSRDAQGNEKENLLSKFMSPGYLTESIGFEYKPNKFFSTRIGTGTARQTFVLDTALYRTNPKNFGVEKGKTIRNELAFQVVMNYEKEIFQNVMLKTKYNMFIPYDNFGHIDHRLDINVIAKINRFMNVSITGVGLYDRDTDLKIQGSQTLALGLVFAFPR
ncbi:DUF3078 domain-containing protein [Pedobacter frigiditerrae]|uniref:DUF3078 domain-containing protein n=1 Tax=Pedobacter frigiditerrae TaxID=2530452 RepID=A0A4R0N1M6_9SPHI|nr:DUF3078 domain-containing protein [Pedobacter frigiditerrae]TCC93681.1 DUF3078 domain-containing protein [Pedobacter frigiditerrae]